MRDQNGNVIAVLQVINKNKKYRDRGAHSFDRTDSIRLHNIASIAAISLQNALLHEEAANNQWRLHELLDCTLALTRASFAFSAYNDKRAREGCSGGRNVYHVAG